MAVSTDVWERMLQAAGKIKGFRPEGARRETGIRAEKEHGMDSMARVEFTLALEDEFRVRIKDEEFEALSTLGDIEDLLRKKVLAS